MVELKRIDATRRHAPAKAATFLEDGAVEAGLTQPAGSTEAGDPGADDRDFH
jgi:hypothetical protein